MNQLKLRSTDTHIGHLSNGKLKDEIRECQNDILDLRRKILPMKHKNDLKIELQYKAKIQIKLCKYLIRKAKSSKNLNVRNWGNRLLTLLKNYSK